MMKQTFNVIMALAIALNSQNLSAQDIGNATIKKTSIDSLIESKMKESGIVGIGAAIIVNKKLVWVKGYGYADKENGKPFTTSTIMNIGSIPKNLTGACIMKAVEDNKLSLDEDINKYLPFKVINPYYPDEKITMRNLATHTSSLADRYPFYDDTYNYAGGSVEELGSFLKNYFEPNGEYYSKENFLDKKPGRYYQYSNIPAALAGYIVEQAVGKKLPEYGKQIIFNPLKMNNTSWSLSQINLANHTKLYDKKGDTLKIIPLYTFPTYPEGGIRTSVSDLAKYFAAILNDGSYNGVRILKKESVKEMKRFQFNASNEPEDLNLKGRNSGIFWATKLGATRIGHNGSDPGVRTFMLSDLTEKIGVVIFFNTTVGSEAIYFDIYDELYKYGQKLKNATLTDR
jgi:CubicO group peptidase (beta-lactamase class C family)